MPPPSPAVWPGTNTLVAVATDNLGAVATSAPVHVLLKDTAGDSDRQHWNPTAGRCHGHGGSDYGISPPGDKTRLFVLEQNGLIRVLQGGVLLPSPALDIQSRVQPPLNAANPNDERGLLGIAFHPGYTNPASPGYRTLYTYNSEMIPASTSPTYPVPTTATNNYKNVLNEWKISAGNASVIDPTSRREIISFGKPQAITMAAPAPSVRTDICIWPWATVATPMMSASVTSLPAATRRT